MGHPTQRAWSRQLIYRTSLGTGVFGLGSPRVSARDLLTLDDPAENLSRRFQTRRLFLDARALRAEDLAPRQVLGNEELDVDELQRFDN
jgi:hypothetical protein